MAPRVSRADLIEEFKMTRRLKLKRGGSMLKAYRVALGFIHP